MITLKIIAFAIGAVFVLSITSSCLSARMCPIDTALINPLPEDSVLYKTVLDRLQSGYVDSDYNSFDRMPGDSVISRSEAPGGRTSFRYIIFDPSIELLAWQKSRVSNEYVWNGVELILYNALLWSTYKDALGEFKWALILATKDEGLAGYISWKLVKVGSGNPIQHYSKPPTNEDVSSFLSNLSTIENHLFVQDSANINREYDVPLEFIDGDVREKTWEAVIGEKPTKFFPNGK